MTTVMDVLNWAILVGVILIFIALIYNKMKEPIDSFFHLLKGWLIKFFGDIFQSEIVVYR